ncbi:MAG: DUF924 family protein [Candidatus Puniceispirillales bacterium]
MRHKESIATILSFWFDEIEPKQWFIKDTNFDNQIKVRFEPLVKRALAGQLDSWSETAEGNLALILLLDQMTRNIYRNMPMSFAGDDMALAFSLKGIDRNDHTTLTDDADNNRLKFLFMPMMHAEDLAIQDKSLPLFKTYCDEQTYKYAVLHRDIIARFGHFPHRNAILGRPSTDEEIAFLKERNSSF